MHVSLTCDFRIFCSLISLKNGPPSVSLIKRSRPLPWPWELNPTPGHCGFTIYPTPSHAAPPSSTMELLPQESINLFTIAPVFAVLTGGNFRWLFNFCANLMSSKAKLIALKSHLYDPPSLFPTPNAITARGNKLVQHCCQPSTPPLKRYPQN